MAQLAVPFPVAVISELLGVPREGNEHIQPMVRAATSLIDAAADEAATEAGQLGVIGLAMYFVELVEAKRADPDDRLLSALIQVEAEGDRLSPEELIANTILLYAAGFETTSNLIGNGLRLLLTHPDQMQRLRAEPELMSSAILEMLRHDSPVQLNMRFALEQVELFGEVHPRGTAFVVLQGGANHDPAAYDRPERFDVGRFAAGTAPQPLSFGWGAHHCLGAHLARAEGEIVFDELLSRTDRIELDEDAVGPSRPALPAQLHAARPRVAAGAAALTEPVDAQVAQVAGDDRGQAQVRGLVVALEPPRRRASMTRRNGRPWSRPATTRRPRCRSGSR